MNIAVLLPGPSLARLGDLPNADLVIGVKRACLRFGCNWAVILDSPDLRCYGDRLIGRPKLLTRADYRPRFCALPGANVEGLYDYCPIRYPGSDGGWFTSTAALALAGWLHASRVDVYGADFGTAETLAEFDGFVSPEANYTASRWERERGVWNAVADWLRGKGVEVYERQLRKRAGIR